MEIHDKCFEYFRSVNPIAQKIAEDIDKIKEGNRKHWVALDVNSKHKIIDDTLIDSCIADKYKNDSDSEAEELEPISKFSWFTRSQLNLFTHLNVKPEKNKTPKKKIDIISPPKKIKYVKVSDNTSKHDKNKSSKEEKSCSKGVAKPKTPPPPPPAKLAFLQQKGLIDDDIPKTGFDFLDNW